MNRTAPGAIRSRKSFGRWTVGTFGAAFFFFFLAKRSHRPFAVHTLQRLRVRIAQVVGYQQPLHVLLFRQAHRDTVVTQGLLFLPQAALVQGGLLLHAT